MNSIAGAEDLRPPSSELLDLCSRDLGPKRSYSCKQCGLKGIAAPSKLQLHIDRMHNGPVTCNICKVEFVDKLWFRVHYCNCYYFCPKENCDFHFKKKSRIYGHFISEHS